MKDQRIHALKLETNVRRYNANMEKKNSSMTMIANGVVVLTLAEIDNVLTELLAQFLMKLRKADMISELSAEKVITIHLNFAFLNYISD